MSTISSDDLRAILAGCEGVTPGPWVSDGAVEWQKGMGPFDEQGAGISGPTDDGCVVQGGSQDEQGGAVGVLRNVDAAHIARLDPQTVASIVRELLSLRESHPIEDGEGWVLVPRDWIEAKGPDPETGEEDPRVIAALRAWRPVMGLADGEYLPIHEHILVPFGRTMQAAMAAAINAAMLAAATAPSNPGTSKVENSRST